MSISGIDATTAVAPQRQIAPDGDSAAAEARESRATKLAEKQNGGIEPKATNDAAKLFNAIMGIGANIDTMG
jgi:hypothetical protein